MMRPYYVGEMNHTGSRTKIVKNGEPELEKQVQLQTIPNPFSNHFIVRFTLPGASMVTVNIYDGKGSLVKKIYTGRLPEGLQQMNVDGSNSVNGVYYCEVTINGQRMLRKMILQK
jgi:spore coat protein A, manganese oxidase